MYLWIAFPLYNSSTLFFGVKEMVQSHEHLTWILAMTSHWSPCFCPCTASLSPTRQREWSYHPSAQDPHTASDRTQQKAQIPKWPRRFDTGCTHLTRSSAPAPRARSLQPHLHPCHSPNLPGAPRPALGSLHMSFLPGRPSALLPNWLAPSFPGFCFHATFSVRLSLINLKLQSNPFSTPTHVLLPHWPLNFFSIILTTS